VVRNRGNAGERWGKDGRERQWPIRGSPVRLSEHVKKSSGQDSGFTNKKNSNQRRGNNIESTTSMVVVSYPGAEDSNHLGGEGKSNGHCRKLVRKPEYGKNNEAVLERKFSIKTTKKKH